MTVKMNNLIARIGIAVVVIGATAFAMSVVPQIAQAQAHKQFTDPANGVVCYIYSSNISCVKVR